jgi:hypothetical protein
MEHGYVGVARETEAERPPEPRHEVTPEDDVGGSFLRTGTDRTDRLRRGEDAFAEQGAPRRDASLGEEPGEEPHFGWGLPDANYWRMHFDGFKTIHGLGARIVLTSPKNDQLRYVLQIHFAASNNVAEYEALVHGLKVSKEIGIRRIMCFGDSDLVIQQCSGIWDAHDANMGVLPFLGTTTEWILQRL